MAGMGSLPGRRERSQRVCEESTKGPPRQAPRPSPSGSGGGTTLTHSHQVAELKAPLQRPLPGHQYLR